MKEPKRELTVDEKQSEMACAALRQHEETEGAMFVEFDELDRQAIAAAERVRVAQMAGSLRANDEIGILNTIRVRRDALKFGWHRRHEQLTAAVEKLWLPVYTSFCKEIRAFIDWAAEQKDITHFGSVGVLEVKKVRAKHNFDSVGAKIDTALGMQKQVQKMRLLPLARVNDFVDECEAELRAIRKDPKRHFPMLEIETSEPAFSEMRATAYQPSAAARTTFRKSFDLNR